MSGKFHFGNMYVDEAWVPLRLNPAICEAIAAIGGERSQLEGGRGVLRPYTEMVSARRQVVKDWWILVMARWAERAAPSCQPTRWVTWSPAM
jgi:hypothetical protein